MLYFSGAVKRAWRIRRKLQLDSNPSRAIALQVGYIRPDRESPSAGLDENFQAENRDIFPCSPGIWNYYTGFCPGWREQFSQANYPSVASRKCARSSSLA